MAADSSNLVVDVAFVRTFKCPVNEDQLALFEVVVFDYVEKAKEQLRNAPADNNYVSSGGALRDIEREFADWKKWAARNVRGTEQEKKSAKFWFTQGEGGYGIINALDNIIHSAMRVQK